MHVESNKGSQKNRYPFGYLFFLSEIGLERRLLATVRWTAATNLAFPQKSEREKEPLWIFPEGSCNWNRKIIRTLQIPQQGMYENRLT